MASTMKRVAIFIFLITSALLLAPISITHADDNPKFISPEQQGGDIDASSNNLQSSRFIGIQSDAYSISCLSIGLACTADSSKTSGYIQKSAVGFLSNAVALTFATPPADLGAWIADTGQSLGFIPKQAYAQGVGFSGLLPLLPLWKVFRNVAYLLMAGVMVIIGFMIMFRKKIDPKTVVTAQNAIPKIIISLILITFSYAIVGFVIDIMYVVMTLLAALFQTAGLSDATTNLASGHLLASIFSFGKFDLFKALFGQIPNSWTIGGITAAIGLAIGLIGTGTAGIGLLVGAIVPIIYVIYAIVLLYLWVKLLFFFLSAYIQIVLSLLIAPLQLLTESFPGSSAFSSWFKNLIANVAVFPVAAAMFMLSAFFQQFAQTNQGGLWGPPYGFKTNAYSVGAFVAIGVLFAIEPVCKSIKEALKAKPVMQPFGGGGGGGFGQLLSSAYYIRMLTPQAVLDRIGLGAKKER